MGQHFYFQHGLISDTFSIVYLAKNLQACEEKCDEKKKCIDSIDEKQDMKQTGKLEQSYGTFMALGPKYPLSNLLPPGMRGKLQILYPLMMFVADWTNDETIKTHKDQGNS